MRYCCNCAKISWSKKTAGNWSKKTASHFISCIESFHFWQWDWAFEQQHMQLKCVQSHNHQRHHHRDQPSPSLCKCVFPDEQYTVMSTYRENVGEKFSSHKIQSTSTIDWKWQNVLYTNCVPTRFMRETVECGQSGRDLTNLRRMRAKIKRRCSLIQLNSFFRSLYLLIMLYTQIHRTNPFRNRDFKWWTQSNRRAEKKKREIKWHKMVYWRCFCCCCCCCTVILWKSAASI